MKQLSALVVLVLLAHGLLAQLCPQHRYVRDVFTDVEETSDIVFGQADPYGPGPLQTLRFDLYEPLGDTLANRPLIIHAFGGAFLIGTRDQPTIPAWARGYARRGFVFASIDYRIGFNPVDSDSPIRAAYRASQDVRAAMRHFAENQSVYGIDTNAIFLTGSSAGCFAGLISAFMEESDRPASTYGTLLEPSDLGCGDCSGNTDYGNREVIARGVINNWGALLDTIYIDPAANPDDMVPVLSFHGDADAAVPYGSGLPFSLPIFPEVDGSAPIHQRLDNVGVPNQLYTLSGRGHEPTLLEPWIVDTIVDVGSRFMVDVLEPQTAPIAGDPVVCIGDTLRYALPDRAGHRFCWQVAGGDVVQDDGHAITVAWTTDTLNWITAVETNTLDVRGDEQVLDVTVGPAPNPAFDWAASDGAVSFDPIDASGISWSWAFGDGDSSAIEAPVHIYGDTSMRTVRFAISNVYCTRTSSEVVDPALCPTAAFAWSAFDSTLTVSDSSAFATGLHWSFGDGAIDSGDLVQHTYAAPGIYDVTLTAANRSCIDAITETIEIVFCPVASFGVSVLGRTIELQDSSRFDDLIQWRLPDGTTSSLSAPSVSVPDTGTYTIRLIAVNVAGCADTATVDVRVSDIVSGLEAGAERSLQWPNPVDAAARIRPIDGWTGGERRVVWVDALGRRIERAIRNESVRAPRSSGVYLLIVEGAAGRTARRIIVR